MYIYIYINIYYKYIYIYIYIYIYGNCSYRKLARVGFELIITDFGSDALAD